MVRSHVFSAVFLALVSANVIQAGLIPGEFFNALPSFVDLVSLPKFGELSHDVFSGAASAASSAYGNFKNYFDDFRLGLGQYVNVPSKYRLLNHFVTSPNLFPLYGNGGADGASAAAAASSATSGGSSFPGIGGAPIAQPLDGFLGGRLGLLRRPVRSYMRNYNRAAVAAANAPPNAAATEA